MLSGLDRLRATTTILQRARVIEPVRGMWEAADVQWWHGRLRATDDLSLPVWYDDHGPVAAAGLTSSGDTWQVDVFTTLSRVSEEEIWGAALTTASQHHDGALELLVHQTDTNMIDLALDSGFTLTDDLSGTTWMDADHRPRVEQVDGFTVVDRATFQENPHPMVARNGSRIESRLRECSLYDSTLDLAVHDEQGLIAGYALFWFDPTTLVGLLEPMRVEEDFQRRGLARALLTNGLDRLANKGARRLKVGFAASGARALYVGAGFVQTSVDRLLLRDIPG